MSGDPGTITNTKPIYKSKTLWLNVIGAVIIFLNVLPNLGLPIPADFQALILAILNILNRFQTQDKVTLT